MGNLLKKLKTKAILLAAGFGAAAAIGATFAWQPWDLNMTNVLTAHTTEVYIHDKETFNPETGDKQVWFENKGTSSVFLRISFTEFWKDEGGEGQENEETSVYLPPTVLSNTIDGQEIAIIYRGEASDGEERWKSQWTDGAAWFDGGDGWYYYRKILKAGERTEEILTKVLFNEKLLAENPEYQKAYYQLYFKAEVVQCSDGSNTLNSAEVNADATEKLFGKTAAVGEDGISVSWQ